MQLSIGISRQQLLSLTRNPFRSPAASGKNGTVNLDMPVFTSDLAFDDDVCRL
jgi:hypothetical protein